MACSRPPASRVPRSRLGHRGAAAAVLRIGPTADGQPPSTSASRALATRLGSTSSSTDASGPGSFPRRRRRRARLHRVASAATTSSSTRPDRPPCSARTRPVRPRSGPAAAATWSSGRARSSGRRGRWCWAATSGLTKPTRTPCRSSARTSPRQTLVRPTPGPVGTTSSGAGHRIILSVGPDQPGGVAGDEQLLVRGHDRGDGTVTGWTRVRRLIRPSVSRPWSRWPSASSTRPRKPRRCEDPAAHGGVVLADAAGEHRPRRSGRAATTSAATALATR